MTYNPDQAISAIRWIIDKYRDNVEALDIRIAIGKTPHEQREAGMHLLRQDALNKIIKILNK